MSADGMQPPRRALLTALMVAFAAGGTLFALQDHFGPRSNKPSLLKLTDFDGHTVTSGALRGKWLLVLFGYTHCPDFCPTALSKIAGLLRALQVNARAIVPVFVTLDPQRDTPELLKTYLANFDSRILGLTGRPEIVGAVARSFDVYFERRPAPGGDYGIDHTAAFTLLDPRGARVATYSYDIQDEDLAESIRDRMAT